MTVRALLWVSLCLLMLGCASTPEPEPPPPPTIVNLQIESATVINPDSSGHAAPVMLRIYELRESSGFESADFFALFDREQATLAADLVRKQEMLIKPGESKMLTIKPDDDVRAVGFFAAFRQLDTAQWRAAAPVTAHETRSFNVKLETNRLTVQPVEPPPKPSE
ncbi:MAG: type VI secretion system lipoprotein TssJ [Methylococcaceae bacterium]|nr:type VI secretion system lipoprotein TssJ [Methylococcaceae bacterium]